MKRVFFSCFVILSILILPGIVFAQANNEETLKLIGSVDLSKYFSYVDKIAINGDTAFVLGWIEIEKPGNPGIAGKQYRELHSVLEIINIGDKANPTVEGALTFDGRISDIAVSGDYVYFLLPRRNDICKLGVASIANPKEPKILTLVPIDIADRGNLAVDGNKLYVITSARSVMEENTLTRYDISNPAEPKVINTSFTDSVSKKEMFRFYGIVYRILAQDGLLYVVSSRDILIFNVKGDKIFLRGRGDNIYQFGSGIATAAVESQIVKDAGMSYLFIAGINNSYFSEPETMEDGSLYTRSEYGVTPYTIMDFGSDRADNPMPERSIMIPLHPNYISADKNLVRIFGVDFNKKTNGLSVVDFSAHGEPKLVGTYESALLGYNVTVSNNIVYTIDQSKHFNILDLPFKGTGYEEYWHKQTKEEAISDYKRGNVKFFYPNRSSSKNWWQKSVNSLHSPYKNIVLMTYEEVLSRPVSGTG